MIWISVYVAEIRTRSHSRRLFRRGGNVRRAWRLHSTARCHKADRSRRGIVCVSRERHTHRRHSWRPERTFTDGDRKAVHDSNIACLGHGGVCRLDHVVQVDPRVQWRSILVVPPSLPLGVKLLSFPRRVALPSLPLRVALPSLPLRVMLPLPCQRLATLSAGPYGSGGKLLSKDF